MKKFVVIENPNKEKAPEYFRIVEKYLSEHGATCISRMTCPDIKNIPKDTECVITLGGDGTMIRAVSQMAPYGIPVIGINLGHLGYLTAVSDKSEIPSMLDALINDEYSIEERIMLRGEWKDKNGDTCSATAFNEIVIARKESLRTVRLRVTVGGVFLSDYEADGIIISTPTGSSAYNLSAGGPIVEATTNLMIITLICPHKLTPGSVVLSADNEIDVEILESESEGQVVAFDGESSVQLEVGDHIIISKSEKAGKVIAVNGSSFTANLRKKLAQLQER